MESCFVLDNCSCIVLPSRVLALVPPASMQSCGKTLLAKFSAHSRYTNDYLESNDQNNLTQKGFPSLQSPKSDRLLDDADTLGQRVVAQQLELGGDREAFLLLFLGGDACINHRR